MSYSISELLPRALTAYCTRSCPSPQPLPRKHENHSTSHNNLERHNLLPFSQLLSNPHNSHSRIIPNTLIPRFRNWRPSPCPNFNPRHPLPHRHPPKHRSLPATFHRTPCRQYATGKVRVRHSLRVNSHSPRFRNRHPNPHPPHSSTPLPNTTNPRLLSRTCNPS